MPTETVEALRGSLLGTVLVEGDPDYDDARRVWNGIIDRHPALIVRCSGVPDVVEALPFRTLRPHAREHQGRRPPGGSRRRCATTAW